MSYIVVGPGDSVIQCKCILTIHLNTVLHVALPISIKRFKGRCYRLINVGRIVPCGGVLRETITHTHIHIQTHAYNV